MSADIVLTCDGRKENYKENSDKCFLIGDTACLSDCAILIQNHLGSIDLQVIEDIKAIYKRNPTDDFNLDDLVKWLMDRLGEYISYEAW